jgi:hypothetical protein
LGIGHFKSQLERRLFCGCHYLSGGGSVISTADNIRLSLALKRFSKVHFSLLVSVLTTPKAIPYINRLTAGFLWRRSGSNPKQTMRFLRAKWHYARFPNYLSAFLFVIIPAMLQMHLSSSLLSVAGKTGRSALQY